MSSSGVPVGSDCISVFQELKLRKKHKYIVFNLNKDLTEIVVECTGDESYEEFIEKALPDDECRWAIYDFEFEKEGAGRRNKLTFISWSPDTAKIKQKMLFASSRDALKRSLNGIAIDIQASDRDDLAPESLLDKANRSA